MKVEAKFETRKKNYETQRHKLINIMDERQDFAIRLRKDKLNNDIHDKRLKYFSSSAVIRIDVSRLELEDSFLQEFKASSDVFSFLSKNLMSTNVNVVKFCISKLNEYISDDQPGIKIEPWFVEAIINKLFDESEEEVKLECSWIIIHLSYKLEEFLQKVLIEQNILNKLIELIGQTVPVVTNHILYIFANLTSRNAKNAKEFIIANTNLLSKLIHYLSITQQNFVRRTLLWNISNVVSYYSINDRRQIVNILINDFMKNENCTRAVLREALTILGGISEDSSESNLEMLFDTEIYDIAVEYLRCTTNEMSKKDIILQEKLVRVLINLTMGNPKQIKKILKCDFVDTFEDLLTKILQNHQFDNDYRRLTKEMISCLSNMVGTSEQITSIIILKSRLPRLTLQLGEGNADISIKNEVVRFFHNALDCSDEKSKFEILRLPVLEYFVDSLKLSDLENLVFSLCGLKYLLEYGREIKISFNEKLNIVQKQVELISGEFYLEKCESSNNKEISSLAQEIMKTYFSNKESNKINN